MNDTNAPAAKTQCPRPDASAHRLVLIALLATLATFVIVTIYPVGKPVDETMELSFGASYGWVVSQCFALTLPGLLAGLLIASILPRTGAVIGAAIIVAVPIIVFCDVITFAWIGERFLSSTMKRISTTLAPAITLHITRSSVIDAIVAITVAIISIVLMWIFAGWVARRWAASREPVRPLTATIVFATLALLMSVPAAWNHSRTAFEMREHSTRHPFCSFHIVGYRGVGFRVPTGEKAILARLRGLQSVAQVQAQDRRQEANRLDEDSFDRDASPLHNVVVVVAESLRHEIIDPKVMPNLYEFSRKSIHCKQHFSGGNSTSYGCFALVNGLEAIWFERPVWKSPIMNRVLHDVGYELAFFGGEDDWTEFGMDGYIRRAHFDAFEIEYPELLDTDYRSVQRNVDYINQAKQLAKEGSPHAVPRLAITYLLNTHCRYISEPEDQIFQPAAPEEFMIPYSMAMRDQIYNRYLNSARTLDRMIKPLLREDCIVIVMGDHGESFLEDGSAIHGLRLSKVQNMTPMILYYPGVEPRTIEQPTRHADILPTLLSILKIPVTDPEVFDGHDLTTIDEQALSERIFVTSNFMDRTSGLIGPWTLDPQQPFAYRFICNLGNWQVDYLNPIDEQGYELAEADQSGADPGRQRVRDWLIREVGPEIVRQDRGERELFTTFFRSEDRETRLSALKIAKGIARPEPYLYDLIAEAARDEDPEIRVMAKEMVIRTERHIGRD